MATSGLLSDIVDVNVGGIIYTARRDTLRRFPESRLGRLTSPEADASSPRDSSGRIYVDADGTLFRFVLNFLRDGRLTLPDNFAEYRQLRSEVERLNLPELLEQIPSRGTSGCIVISYRGSFAFGKDVGGDVKFRKISRLVVCGKISLCREVFGESLNESRGLVHDSCERYSQRLYLKHNWLEQAFDALAAAGFQLRGASASGTNGQGDMKPGIEPEEQKWMHYNEFVFIRG